MAGAVLTVPTLVEDKTVLERWAVPTLKTGSHSSEPLAGECPFHHSNFQVTHDVALAASTKIHIKECDGWVSAAQTSLQGMYDVQQGQKLHSRIQC